MVAQIETHGIAEQLDALDAIDSMALTHYDDDHLGGVLSSFACF